MRPAHADIRPQTEQQAGFTGARLARERFFERGCRLERATELG